MAIPPINPQILPAAPGRPAAPAERMPVPGRPHAEANRPEASPGRIPVAQQGDDGDPLKLFHQIDRQVKSSAEYQALRPFLEQAGLTDGEDSVSAPAGVTSEAALEADSGSTTNSVVQSETAVAATRFTTVEITVDQISYQRVTVRMTQEPEAPPRRSDPLALDLNGDGLHTTGIEHGVHFDIDADGHSDKVSFVSGGDAFLALDRNGNGLIDDGTELFGDQNGDAHGFDALGRYDENGDGQIDNRDSIYQQLRLFTLDAAGRQRLESLADAGIASLSLDYRDTATMLNRYDSIAQSGSFTREDGSRGELGDLMLGFKSRA